MTAESARDEIVSKFDKLAELDAQFKQDWPAAGVSQSYRDIRKTTAALVPPIDELCVLAGLPNGLTPPVVEPPVEPPPPEELVYPESSVFGPGGPYERLTDPLADEPWEVLSHAVPVINSHHRNKNGPDAPWPFPTSTWKGRRLLGNNAQATWGDRGPLWGVRCYDVVGTIDDLTLQRIGDWTSGREGHACYVNVMGDVLVRNLHARQVGGQCLQVVGPYNRVNETNVPKALWPTAAHTLRIENIEATDCGLINQGTAVRASWPLALYSPGCNIEGVGGLVRTIDSPPFQHHGGTWRSHGALFVGTPGVKVITHKLTWTGLVVDIIAPDREEFRLWAVGLAELEDFDVSRRRLDGTDESPVLSIVDDCGKVVLRNWTLDKPLTINIHPAINPYAAAYRVEKWDGVGTKEIVP